MRTPQAFPGLHTPAAGFEQPFAMLEACHARVQRMLTLLQKLCAHLRAQGCDQVQGYHYSRPLLPEHLETFVRANLQARQQGAAPPAHTAQPASAVQAEVLAKVQVVENAT